MKIEIEQIQGKDWQIKITEPISRTDSFHHIDRVTTSPLMLNFSGAVNWLVEWEKIVLS